MDWQKTPGFDRRLLTVLGENLYAGDPFWITFRELIQNSVDSRATKIEVKCGSPSGKQELSSDVGYDLTVSDNGHGMSCAVLQKEFIDIGGSLKDGPAAGGYGIAKVGIFARAKSVRVLTRTATEESTLSFTGEEWCSGEVKGSTRRNLTGHHGTSVTITLTRYPNWYKVREFLGIFKLLRPDVSITVTDTSYSLPVKVAPDGLEANLCLVDTHLGSTYRVYTVRRTSSYSHQYRVANFGMYQGITNVVSLHDLYPHDFLVDVQPGVSPEEDRYPFFPERERLREDAKNHIDSLCRKVAAETERSIHGRILDILDSDDLVKDTTGANPLIKELLETSPQVERVYRAAKVVHDRLLAELGVGLSRFSGLMFDPKILGLNFKSTMRRYVFLNPWTVGSAGQAVATLWHEVCHNSGNSDCSREFSNLLTHTMPAVARLFGELVDAFQGVDWKALSGDFDGVRNDIVEAQLIKGDG